MKVDADDIPSKHLCLPMRVLTAAVFVVNATVAWIQPLPSPPSHATFQGSDLSYERHCVSRPLC